MKIDLHKPPEQDIFHDQKKYILWFIFFMLMACVAVAIGCYAIYSDGYHGTDLEDYALGILVISSLGVTRFGNRLQKYKVLFPPQREKLTLLRTQYQLLEDYCAGVEALQRRFIRAEYQACVDYANKQDVVKTQTETTNPVIYGPVEQSNTSVSDDSSKE